MQAPHITVLLSLLLLHLVAASTTAPSPAPAPAKQVGQYTPIKNLSDPHVVEIARFAVEEHNKQGTPKLHLVRILKGWTQVVAGINYRLILAARPLVPPSHVHNYEAIVYERAWEHFRNLTSFKLLKQH